MFVCTPCPRAVSTRGVVGRSYGSRSRWIWYIAQHHAVLLKRELAGHVRSRRLPRPIYDFEGKPRSFDELLKSAPASASSKISAAAQAERHQQTMDAMDRLQSTIATAKLDVLVIVGDDQREIFGDECRPAIAVYYGGRLRNAPTPAEPPTSWYHQAQRNRMAEKHERFYPCHAGLGTYMAAGLTDRG